MEMIVTSEHGREDREADAHERAPAGARRQARQAAAGDASEHDEREHGQRNGPERAQRLAQEDLDLEPGQLEQAAQHDDGSLSRESSGR